MLSRNCLKELSEKLPDVLKMLCDRNYLQNSELTFALEYLGRTEDVKYEPYLRELCLDASRSAMVREGAYYGLSNYDVELMDVIKSFSESDSSGLKDIAKCYE